MKAGRIWAMAVMLGYPVVSYVETLIFAGILRDIVDLFCALLFTLGGFFITKYPAKRASDAFCRIMGFSLLRALEFFEIRKMEMPETYNHPLCGCAPGLYTKITFPL